MIRIYLRVINQFLSLQLVAVNKSIKWLINEFSFLVSQTFFIFNCGVLDNCIDGRWQKLFNFISLLCFQRGNSSILSWLKKSHFKETCQLIIQMRFSGSSKRWFMWSGRTAFDSNVPISLRLQKLIWIRFYLPFILPQQSTRIDVLSEMFHLCQTQKRKSLIWICQQLAFRKKTRP